MYERYRVTWPHGLRYVTEDSCWAMKEAAGAILWESTGDHVLLIQLLIWSPVCIPNLTLGQAGREIQESIQESRQPSFPSFSCQFCVVWPWHSLKIRAFLCGEMWKVDGITNLMDFLQTLCNMTCIKGSACQVEHIKYSCTGTSHSIVNISELDYENCCYCSVGKLCLTL